MAVSNNWANLRSFLRKTHNREVNEWFRDIDSDSLPDNATARSQAKRACLILPKETQNTALLKALTFRFTVQRVHLRPHVYGVPVGTMDAQRKHRPQIVLEFLEDEYEATPGLSRVDGRISFRLMDEDSDSITKAKLTTIANKVKSEFGTPKGYVWQKGRDLASYIDKSKGYQLQLLVQTKSDAKEIVNKVLDLRSQTPDWSKFSYKENEEPADAFPAITGSQSILGTVYKKPRVRPVAKVRFQYAVCTLWGNPQGVILYDASYRFLDTLVS